MTIYMKVKDIVDKYRGKVLDAQTSEDLSKELALALLDE